MKKWMVVSWMMTMPMAVWGATATVDLKGTAPNSPINGTIRLEDTPQGLHVRTQMVSAPAGKHGFHIHEFGSCDQQAKAAGAHYNPKSLNHGSVMKAGVQHVHAGDLGNITVNSDGSATIDVTIPTLTLTDGPYSVAGRSIVLHEKEDDLTSQPAGNAGNRIACGPILLSGSTAQ